MALQKYQYMLYRLRDRLDDPEEEREDDFEEEDFEYDDREEDDL
jgi:hypothetical protein